MVKIDLSGDHAFAYVVGIFCVEFTQRILYILAAHVNDFIPDKCFRWVYNKIRVGKRVSIK